MWLRLEVLDQSSTGRTLNQGRRRRRTLLHDFQSHWKGRVVGSFSTSSISSISFCYIVFVYVGDEARTPKTALTESECDAGV